MTDTELKVLLIEDNQDDALLVKRLLKYARQKIAVVHVSGFIEAVRFLREGTFDLILLDLNLPDSAGIPNVQKLNGLAPAIPVIVLSGMDEEKLAMECLEKGAQDYLTKGRADTDSMSRAIRYAIQRKKFYDERERLIRELQEAVTNVKTLSGLLPICGQCKKVRDYKGYWEEVESYVSKRSKAQFTQGLCPECAKKAEKQAS